MEDSVWGLEYMEELLCSLDISFEVFYLEFFEVEVCRQLELILMVSASSLLVACPPTGGTGGRGPAGANLKSAAYSLACR